VRSIPPAVNASTVVVTGVRFCAVSVACTPTCMIAANVCAAIVLREKLGFGIYNIHNGFDPVTVEQAVAILASNEIQADAQQILTLEGFCVLRRQLDALPTQFLDSRMRRFQSFAEISTEPGPHFGLGLEAYATWTSPIRKYGDMVNHRLLKAIITGQAAEKPQEDVTVQLAERRRLNRMYQPYAAATGNNRNSSSSIKNHSLVSHRLGRDCFALIRVRQLLLKTFDFTLFTA